MKKIGLACSLVYLVAQSGLAKAEDDILNILEGAQPAQQSATSTYKTPLRSLISNLNGEQQIFFQFIDQADFEKALFQWPEAFKNSEFEKSDDGIGLYSLLLYKNKLEVSAIETLFTVKKPKALAAHLVKEWQQVAPESSTAWGVAQLPNWQEDWTGVFGEAIEIRVRGRELYGFDQVDLLKSLLVKSKPGSAERAMIQWQLVLALSEKDTGESAKVLAHLMKQENNPISKDLMTLSAARFLYKKGFMDAAIKYYEKIPKSSDYWFESQEEIGWAFMRKGDPNKTLAESMTLTQSYFLPLAGPETQFLKALAQLKVCDYSNVMKTLQVFQTEFKPRAKVLMSVAEGEISKAVQSTLEELKKGKMKQQSLKGEARNIPRLVSRDRVLLQLVQTQKSLEAESQIAGGLYSRSLAGGSAKVGFEGFFETLKNKIEQRAHSAKSASVNRIKLLSQNEVDEIGLILKKMHIVEAEVIQQVSLAERVIKDSKNSAAISKVSDRKLTSNQIQFPISKTAANELWFDELDNYSVDVKNGCQAVKR